MTGLIKHVVGLAVGLAVASAGLAVAGQQRPYRLDDQQLKDLVNRIVTHGDAFNTSLKRAIDRSSINGSSGEDQIDRSVKMFQQATDILRDRVNDQQSETADAQNVLSRATSIDDFMMRNQLDASAQSGWQALRWDMNDLARAYGITWNWRATSQNIPSRVDDKQVEQLLKQIGKKADNFDKGLDRAFDGSRIDDSRRKDELRRSVKDFRQATDRLRDRVKGRQSNTLDAEEVLRRGVSINATMQRYQLSTQAERDWLSLRGDLDTLARAYNVAWNWSNPVYTAHTPAQPGAGFQNRLTGTYQLENSRSDDPRRAAELAVRDVPSDQRQRTYQSLLTRLEAPELIAIERNDNSVTMASTRGGRVTFEADGRDYRERWSTDRTMNTRATFEGDRLVVATTGNRGSDFTATFDPTENGRSLQMTRTIDDQSLRQPVTVRSSYQRLSDAAQWDVDTGGRRDPYTDTRSWEGDFVVPNGTRLVASLDNDLSTTTAREGDPFTMTIHSPSQYEGAVVQGFVSSATESGRLTGRAGMTLDLRSIRLRNGRSSQFDGVIEEIRTPDGETVRVDREGAVDTEDSQTRMTVERGAIGAALGAVIGAVVGGGSGAAIGAAIGAGAGAGSVLIGGRDRLDLPRGTEVTITSGDPTYRTTPDVQR
ncbi:MAG: YMGG-like glycine zipper-containing protein [Acidobacteriota bacterium]